MTLQDGRKETHAEEFGRITGFGVNDRKCAQIFTESQFSEAWRHQLLQDCAQMIHTCRPRLI